MRLAASCGTICEESSVVSVQNAVNQMSCRVLKDLVISQMIDNINIISNHNVDDHIKTSCAVNYLPPPAEHPHETRDQTHTACP